MSRYKSEYRKTVEAMSVDKDPAVRLKALEILERLERGRKPRPTVANQILALVRGKEQSDPKSSAVQVLSNQQPKIAEIDAVAPILPATPHSLPNLQQRPINDPGAKLPPPITPNWLDLDREDPVPKKFLDRKHAAAYAHRMNGQPQQVVIESVPLAAAILQAPRQILETGTYSQEGGYVKTKSEAERNWETTQKKNRMANMSESTFRREFFGIPEPGAASKPKP